MIVLYFLLPLNGHKELRTIIVLGAGVVMVIALLILQVRATTKSPYPRLRAIEAVATTLPLFLVVFAVTHYVTDHVTTGSYTEPMTRVDALYYTITVFATVGFGDIAPVSETARVITMVQMIGDLLLIGAVAKVLIGAVQIGLERRERSQPNSEETPSDD